MVQIEIITLDRPGGPPGPGRPDPGRAFLLVNGVIVTLGGIYASTHSVPVTAVAGCVLVSAMLYGWKKLRDEEGLCRGCPRVSANGRAT